MTKSKIRIPKQRRSIKKKEAIVESAFQLFSEQGYFNTDTAQIAKKAGVSTGILYNYFRNKHDILCEVVAVYITQIENGINELIDKHAAKKDIGMFINDIYELVVASHVAFSKAQNQFSALALLDDEIHQMFKAFKERQIHSITNLFFPKSSQEDSISKTLFMFEIIEKVCHLYVAHEITQKQYYEMREMSIKMFLSVI